MSHSVSCLSFMCQKEKIHHHHFNQMGVQTPKLENLLDFENLNQLERCPHLLWTAMLWFSSRGPGQNRDTLVLWKSWPWESTATSRCHGPIRVLIMIINCRALIGIAMPESLWQRKGQLTSLPWHETKFQMYASWRWQEDEDRPREISGM